MCIRDSTCTVHNKLSCTHLQNKKHLENVGPIRHCEPLHCHSPGVATVARRHCRMPPAHRCPRRRRRQRQRQRVTEGTAMAPWNGPNYTICVSLKSMLVSVSVSVSVLWNSSFCVHTDVWIVSDGRNYGASRIIGRMLAEPKRKSKPCDVDSDDEDDVWLASRPSDPVLIGVSHWGSLKRKKLLGGISVSHPLTDRCASCF